MTEISTNSMQQCDECELKLNEIAALEADIERLRSALREIKINTTHKRDLNEIWITAHEALGEDE
jgi:hypothetical protein